MPHNKHREKETQNGKILYILLPTSVQYYNPSVTLHTFVSVLSSSRLKQSSII